MSMFMYEIIRNYRGNFALSILNTSILKRLLRKFCLRWQCIALVCFQWVPKRVEVDCSMTDFEFAIEGGRSIKINANKRKVVK